MRGDVSFEKRINAESKQDAAAKAETAFQAREFEEALAVGKYAKTRNDDTPREIIKAPWKDFRILKGLESYCSLKELIPVDKDGNEIFQGGHPKG